MIFANYSEIVFNDLPYQRLQPWIDLPVACFPNVDWLVEYKVKFCAVNAEKFCYISKKGVNLWQKAITIIALSVRLNWTAQIITEAPMTGIALIAPFAAFPIDASDITAVQCYGV